MIYTYYNRQLYSATIDINDLPYKTRGDGELCLSTYWVSGAVHNS